MFTLNDPIERYTFSLSLYSTGTILEAFGNHALTLRKKT